MSEPDKFCVDCRHQRNDRCARAPLPGHSELLGRWLVNGQGERPAAQDYFYCWVERASASEMACGPSGRFWEAKASPGSPTRIDKQDNFEPQPL